MNKFYGALLPIFILSQSGCSLFIGNIKPVEEKSTSYGVADLSKANSDWIRLDSKSIGEQKEGPAPGFSDVVYQSLKTGSVISINSVCKSYENSQNKKNLKKLTTELLLGISEITFQEEKEVEVADMPALQTTVSGHMNNEKMTLRTVVLQRGRCVYDLMYVARPERFEETVGYFSQFVSSLHLR